MAYPGWKLGEKKTIKAKLEVLDAAQKIIQGKLGSDWTIDIDWQKMSDLSEGNSYRSDCGRYIIDIVKKCADDDVAKFDEDLVKTINKLGGDGPKVVKFTMGSKDDAYANGRCNVAVAPGVITLTWKADYLGYSYSGTYIADFVSGMAGVAADSPMAGEWTLAEIKSVKAKQSSLDSATTTLKSKFGDDWKIDIDWGKGDEMTKGNSYRSDVGRYVIDDVVKKCIDDDIVKMDQDVVDTINKIVGGNKTLNFTFGSKDIEYKNGRCNVTINAETGLTAIWKQDYLGYSYSDAYITTFVCDLAGVAASPPFAGKWTLKEIKSVQAAMKDVDAATKQLQGKVGDDWKIEIDWAAFDTNTVGNSYRSDVGRYICTDIVLAFAKADADKFDGDVSEALNDAVGAKKVVQFTCGAKGETYEKSRCGVTVNPDTGVVIRWNPEYLGYSYSDEYVNQWVLANC